MIPLRWWATGWHRRVLLAAAVVLVGAAALIAIGVVAGWMEP